MYIFLIGPKGPCWLGVMWAKNALALSPGVPQIIEMRFSAKTNSSPYYFSKKSDFFNRKYVLETERAFAPPRSHSVLLAKRVDNTFLALWDNPVKIVPLILSMAQKITFTMVPI